jgi:hypothetical protein
VSCLAKHGLTMSVYEHRKWGQQDFPFIEFMGCALTLSFMGFWEIDAKNTRGDYLGLSHPVAKHLTHCVICDVFS